MVQKQICQKEVAQVVHGQLVLMSVCSLLPVMNRGGLLRRLLRV